ncbi:Hypothetical protein NTJ_09236 [Nesidiocoris tenuis]|uniref:Single domain-containing protein n=1 Tax=Nesidiocoris tenuis TaxID=355587 RepID=A0ABN7AW74_9HEMI|nr:Hypothetical protein NTJ_09236 [Nesidiocoris tenuis]
MWAPADERLPTCEYMGENLKIGEIYYPPKHCFSVECVGKKGWAEGIETKTCPPLPMTDLENFRYVERTHLKYPDCCPTLELVEDNVVSY